MIPPTTPDSGRVQRNGRVDNLISRYVILQSRIEPPTIPARTVARESGTRECECGIGNPKMAPPLVTAELPDSSELKTAKEPTPALFRATAPPLFPDEFARNWQLDIQRLGV